MKFIVEDDILIVYEGNKVKDMDLWSREAFEYLSKLWLKVGFKLHYVRQFTWQGLPVLQLPEDLIRIQEVLYQIRPDVIIEVGVSHGGSLLFYASLCKLMQIGRVIGVDLSFPSREKIENSIFSKEITLVQGNSISKDTIQEITRLVSPGERGFVILDSNHTKDHVLTELQLYSKFVGFSSYIVACDGINKEFADLSPEFQEWSWNNPEAAIKEFLHTNSSFVLETPRPLIYDERVKVRNWVTYWPDSFLRRIK